MLLLLLLRVVVGARHGISNRWGERRRNVQPRWRGGVARRDIGQGPRLDRVATRVVDARGRAVGVERVASDETVVGRREPVGHGSCEGWDEGGVERMSGDVDVRSK